ncbi:MAG: CDP-alcohol phosphatidyltransferase family protein [Tannerellaceae bacterium]|nr:CDP-alcohol phosphatidyltransferase family protein [Tannerellaceae bacterium]
MNEQNKEYEASLKSIETENYIDRVFYRPIGFRITTLLRNTGITPNQITIFSIFVGAAGGYCFYPANIWYTLMGILFLVSANILDCVDGQLARLTGIKSKIGRILDGLAGDIWFACIYFAFAFRLGDVYGYTNWFILLGVISGLSHLVQANITDYYKTLHLYFISKEKGYEFRSERDIQTLKSNMKYGINRFLNSLYRRYTHFQIYSTPQLQKMLKRLHDRYRDDIPDDVRVAFRKKSRHLMKYIDLMTFNGRTIPMFFFVLSGQVWLYFIYEIVFLNLVLIFVMRKHEKMCASFD